MFVHEEKGYLRQCRYKQRNNFFPWTCILPTTKRETTCTEMIDHTRKQWKTPGELGIKRRFLADNRWYALKRWAMCALISPQQCLVKVNKRQVNFPLWNTYPCPLVWIVRDLLLALISQKGASRPLFHLFPANTLRKHLSTIHFCGQCNRTTHSLPW